jgi:hypothetical protein
MAGLNAAGRAKHNVLGALSIPIGRHRIVPLPADEAGARHLDYAILDIDGPVPEPLARAARRVVDAPPFRVLAF